jgi:large subunit ribosomal protein L6
MSRIGKKPVPIPEKVKDTVQAHKVVEEGPKGRLEHVAHPKTKIAVSGKEVLVTLLDQDRMGRCVWGLTRSLISNMVQGVSTGFERSLEIVGVGFKAELKGTEVLAVNCGLSHTVQFPMPKGVTVDIEKGTKLTFRSADKQLLGATVSALRKIRPPEPYKGKGIKYADEIIKRKEGKTGAG